VKLHVYHICTRAADDWCYTSALSYTGEVSTIFMHNILIWIGPLWFWTFRSNQWHLP